MTNFNYIFFKKDDKKSSLKSAILGKNFYIKCFKCTNKHPVLRLKGLQNRFKNINTVKDCANFDLKNMRKIMTHRLKIIVFIFK